MQLRVRVPCSLSRACEANNFSVYGNEKEVGIAIKESGIPRAKLYITTKYDGSNKPLDIAESFEISLKNLGVEYIDQYLLHDPFFASGSTKKLQDAWAAMESLVASGKTRSIGVSNFSQKDLEAVLETAKVIPAINQIEYHPYLQHRDLIAFQKKHGIATSAYGPLTAVTKASPGPLDGTYAALAKKYGVTTGDIALRWVIDQGIVALTTSSNEERLKGYQKIGELKLTPEEVEEIRIKGLGKNFRGFWNHKIAKDDFN